MTFLMMFEQWYEGLVWFRANGVTVEIANQLFKKPTGYWWFEIVSTFPDGA